MVGPGWRRPRRHAQGVAARMDPRPQRHRPPDPTRRRPGHAHQRPHHRQHHRLREGPTPSPCRPSPSHRRSGVPTGFLDGRPCHCPRKRSSGVAASAQSLTVREVMRSRRPIALRLDPAASSSWMFVCLARLLQGRSRGPGVRRRFPASPGPCACRIRVLLPLGAGSAALSGEVVGVRPSHPGDDRTRCLRPRDGAGHRWRWVTVFRGLRSRRGFPRRRSRPSLRFRRGRGGRRWRCRRRRRYRRRRRRRHPTWRRRCPRHRRCRRS